MSGRFAHLSSLRICLVCVFAFAIVALSGCDLEMPKKKEAKSAKQKLFDLSDIAPIANPPRPAGVRITAYAVEYTVDLDVPAGKPGHASEVRVVLPKRMPADKVPALVVNGSGAYLFSGMVLSDEDIEPMLPYVEKGFAVIAYETDGCQPSFNREPTSRDIAQMTRSYVASKAGLVNAERALSFALDRFPEIDPGQLYTIGHSSGGKQALLLAAHDDRIRGCVAFAPACRMDLPSKMTVARIGGPDGDKLSREVDRSMPLVHAKATKTPMLLLFSPNDQVTRPDEVLSYAKAVGGNAKAIPVKCDGHGYVPDAGFPIAVMWLRAQSKLNAKKLDVNLVSQSVQENVTDDAAENAAENATEQIKESEPEQPELVNDQQVEPPAKESELSTPEPAPSPVKPAHTRRPSRSIPLPAGVKRNPYFD